MSEFFTVKKANDLLEKFIQRSEQGPREAPKPSAYRGIKYKEIDKSFSVEDLKIFGLNAQDIKRTKTNSSQLKNKLINLVFTSLSKNLPFADLVNKSKDQAEDKLTGFIYYLVKNIPNLSGVLSGNIELMATQAVEEGIKKFEKSKEPKSEDPIKIFQTMPIDYNVTIKDFATGKDKEISVDLNKALNLLNLTPKDLEADQSNAKVFDKIKDALRDKKDRSTNPKEYAEHQERVTTLKALNKQGDLVSLVDDILRIIRNNKVEAIKKGDYSRDKFLNTQNKDTGRIGPSDIEYYGKNEEHLAEIAKNLIKVIPEKSTETATTPTGDLDANTLRRSFVPAFIRNIKNLKRYISGLTSNISEGATELLKSIPGEVNEKQKEKLERGVETDIAQYTKALDGIPSINEKDYKDMLLRVGEKVKEAAGTDNLDEIADLTSAAFKLYNPAYGVVDTNISSLENVYGSEKEVGTLEKKLKALNDLISFNETLYNKLPSLNSDELEGISKERYESTQKSRSAINKAIKNIEEAKKGSDIKDLDIDNIKHIISGNDQESLEDTLEDYYYSVNDFRKYEKNVNKKSNEIEKKIRIEAKEKIEDHEDKRQVLEERNRELDSLNKSRLKALRTFKENKVIPSLDNLIKYLNEYSSKAKDTAHEIRTINKDKMDTLRKEYKEKYDKLVNITQKVEMYKDAFGSVDYIKENKIPNNILKKALAEKKSLTQDIKNLRKELAGITSKVVNPYTPKLIKPDNTYTKNEKEKLEERADLKSKRTPLELEKDNKESKFRKRKINEEVSNDLNQIAFGKKSPEINLKEDEDEGWFHNWDSMRPIGKEKLESLKKLRDDFLEQMKSGKKLMTLQKEGKFDEIEESLKDVASFFNNIKKYMADEFRPSKNTEAISNVIELFRKGIISYLKFFSKQSGAAALWSGTLGGDLDYGRKVTFESPNFPKQINDSKPESKQTGYEYLYNFSYEDSPSGFIEYLKNPQILNWLEEKFESMKLKTKDDTEDYSAENKKVLQGPSFKDLDHIISSLDTLSRGLSEYNPDNIYQRVFSRLFKRENVEEAFKDIIKKERATSKIKMYRKNLRDEQKLEKTSSDSVITQGLKKLLEDDSSIDIFGEESNGSSNKNKKEAVHTLLKRFAFKFSPESPQQAVQPMDDTGTEQLKWEGKEVKTKINPAQFLNPDYVEKFVNLLENEQFSLMESIAEGDIDEYDPKDPEQKARRDKYVQFREDGGIDETLAKIMLTGDLSLKELYLNPERGSNIGLASNIGKRIDQDIKAMDGLEKKYERLGNELNKLTEKQENVLKPLAYFINSPEDKIREAILGTEEGTNLLDFYMKSFGPLSSEDKERYESIKDKRGPLTDDEKDFLRGMEKKIQQNKKERDDPYTFKKLMRKLTEKYQPEKKLPSYSKKDINSLIDRRDEAKEKFQGLLKQLEKTTGMSYQEIASVARSGKNLPGGVSDNDLKNLFNSEKAYKDIDRKIKSIHEPDWRVKLKRLDNQDVAKLIGNKITDEIQSEEIQSKNLKEISEAFGEIMSKSTFDSYDESIIKAFKSFKKLRKRVEEEKETNKEDLEAVREINSKLKEAEKKKDLSSEQKEAMDSLKEIKQEIENRIDLYSKIVSQMENLSEKIQNYKQEYPSIVENIDTILKGFEEKNLKEIFSTIENILNEARNVKDPDEILRKTEEYRVFFNSVLTGIHNTVGNIIALKNKIYKSDIVDIIENEYSSDKKEEFIKRIQSLIAKWNNAANQTNQKRVTVSEALKKGVSSVKNTLDTKEEENISSKIKLLTDTRITRMEDLGKKLRERIITKEEYNQLVALHKFNNNYFKNIGLIDSQGNIDSNKFKDMFEFDNLSPEEKKEHGSGGIMQNVDTGKKRKKKLQIQEKKDNDIEKAEGKDFLRQYKIAEEAYDPAVNLPSPARYNVRSPKPFIKDWDVIALLYQNDKKSLNALSNLNKEGRITIDPNNVNDLLNVDRKIIELTSRLSNLEKLNNLSVNINGKKIKVREAAKLYQKFLGDYLENKTRLERKMGQIQDAMTSLGYQVKHYKDIAEKKKTTDPSGREVERYYLKKDKDGGLSGKEIRSILNMFWRTVYWDLMKRWTGKSGKAMFSERSKPEFEVLYSTFRNLSGVRGNPVYSKILAGALAAAKSVRYLRRDYNRAKNEFERVGMDLDKSKQLKLMRQKVQNLEGLVKERNKIYNMIHDTVNFEKQIVTLKGILKNLSDNDPLSKEINSRIAEIEKAMGHNLNNRQSRRKFVEESKTMKERVNSTIEELVKEAPDIVSEEEAEKIKVNDKISDVDLKDVDETEDTKEISLELKKYFEKILKTITEDFKFDFEESSSGSTPNGGYKGATFFEGVYPVDFIIDKDKNLSVETEGRKIYSVSDIDSPNNIKQLKKSMSSIIDKIIEGDSNSSKGDKKEKAASKKSYRNDINFNQRILYSKTVQNKIASMLDKVLDKVRE